MHRCKHLDPRHCRISAEGQLWVVGITWLRIYILYVIIHLADLDQLFFLTFESTIFLKFIVGDSVVLKVLKVFFCADSFLLTPLNSNWSIEGYILYVFHFFYFYFQGGNITSEYVNYYILCFLSTRCTFIAVSKP